MGNLEHIISKDDSERCNDLLGKVFFDKIRNLKATIKALFQEILLREISLGLFIGLSLGIAATLWAFWLQGNWTIAIVVGMSFIFVITVATTIGTFLPMLVKKIGFDPALIATPLITTTIDVTALLIYFMIARHLLGLHM